VNHIQLTEEQAGVLRDAREVVPVLDPSGGVVAVIDPINVAALRSFRERRQSPQPGVPLAKVLEHRRALEAEWERTGGFDTEYARAFLDRLREQDARESV
jgi:hypothetical protein